MQSTVDSPDESESLFSGRSSAWSVLRCIFALMLLSNFGGSMLDVPMVRLLEQAVCRDYYRTAYLDIDEQLCKVGPVQSALASVVGWQRFFMFIPGLLTAYFFGGLADKYGRKPIASLAFTGEALAVLWTPTVCYFHTVFPTKLVWLSSAFYFIGGGSRVLTCVIFTMVADVVPAKHRSTVMYYISTLVNLTSLLGPPFGAWILQKNIWLPFALCAVLLLVCYPVLFILPETLRPRSQNYVEHVTCEPPNENSPLLNSDAAQIQHFPSTNIFPTAPISLVSFDVLACLSIFFLRMFASGASQFLLQYMSKRFSAPLHTFGWVSPLQSGGSIAVNGLLLPVVIQSFARYFTPQEVDLSIVQWSLFFATTAAVVIGLAAHPALIVMGLLLQVLASGLDPSLQSLAASFVQRNHTARLYTVTAVIEATAGMISGPVMAGMFTIGLSSGSAGMGACFFLAAAGYAVAMGSSLGIGVKWLEMAEERWGEERWNEDARIY